jgi:hypothetical protein
MMGLIELIKGNKRPTKRAYKTAVIDRRLYSESSKNSDFSILIKIIALNIMAIIIAGITKVRLLVMVIPKIT